MQAALSQMTKGQGTSQPEVNVSPPGKLKSSCASTEVPTIQDDTKLHFPVDDVTEAFTTCEVHVSDGNATKNVDMLLSTLLTERELQEFIIDQYLVDMLASRLIGLRKVVAICL